ncbi:hypothetical protein EI555_009509 [Monodon monoceros]|uniref:Insulin gene enhancer protein ISL-1 n=1 Tax=Monodon monoceros TaxID=40151 RepID=A0A4U1FM66_MONMO|nr:hypothetical protein EI555_009509 [Monodon monoceros]
MASLKLLAAEDVVALLYLREQECFLHRLPEDRLFQKRKRYNDCIAVPWYGNKANNDDKQIRFQRSKGPDLLLGKSFTHAVSHCSWKTEVDVVNLAQVRMSAVFVPARMYTGLLQLYVYNGSKRLVNHVFIFISEKRLISLCVGCGNQIHDQYILRVSPDLEWHAACLKCAECNQYLDESCTCFVRDGKTYCKRDYIRLYGIKCAKCSIGFSKNDFVMRARSKVYHIECFRCVACSRQLIPGDEFALREDGLFCRADHDVVERASLGAGDPLSPLHPSRPLQMAAEPISARQPALRPHVHKQPEKTTRVRTVLNEKQLHTLRTCYAANPRPDALMKEQLVEMTGLSPRVIRVWFQNKRCKDKKRSIMMKQLQQQQPNDKTNIQGMTGTPMVAASPERHDGGLQANPVEVQSYQPPWKVLSDFALQSDIDQPAFQQLVNFSEGGPGSNSTGSEVASMSSQLPDTPNSMVASPIEA